MFGKKSPPITEAWRGFTFTRRALVVGGAQAAVGVALAARMAYISVIDNERYVLEAESNRVNLTLVPPRRGWIVDRNGKALANNRVSLRVDIIPDRLHNKENVLGQLRTLLRLDNDAMERIERDLKAASGFQPVAIAEDMTEQEYSSILVHLPELPGVAPQRGFARNYPTGAAVGHLIGYVGARSGRSEFAPAGHGHGDSSAAVDSMLGEAMPDHVKPDTARAIRLSALWLALWLVPVIGLLLAFGQGNVFSQIALFFSKMALVTFGGAYAVLAYVAQQAVEHYHWLKPHEMLDGLGMAETTPGPLIMVLQFVGFMAAYRDPSGLSPMLAATLGGLLATWVTFTPCFLWIFLGAPYIERLRGNTGLAGALSAITAAVVGVILNLSIWFALHTLFRETVPVHACPLDFDMPVPRSVDLPALLLAVAAATAIFRFKLGMLTVLAGSCAAGLALRLAAVI